MTNFKRFQNELGKNIWVNMDAVVRVLFDEQFHAHRVVVTLETNGPVQTVIVFKSLKEAFEKLDS